MAKKRRRRKKLIRRIRKAPIIITLLVVIAVVGILLWQNGVFDRDDNGRDDDNDSPIIIVGEGEEVSFHIIDVGQGDAILIRTGEGNMLIDSGDLSSDSQEKLASYLEAEGIESFEYVVFTHTDADHIGSGDIIINNYDVKTVIMPDYQATTKVFGRLVDAIEEKEVDLILIGEDKDCTKSGYTFSLGPITHTVMAPTEDFSDPNEMSVVIKSVYGETSILLTGDAEEKSEEAMLEEYERGELDVDILKAGHHGSSTSTTQEFFDELTPEAVIISCGEGNKYGHPHKEILDMCADAEVEVYRTDKNGTVVIRTDGVTYTIETEK